MRRSSRRNTRRRCAHPGRPPGADVGDRDLDAEFERIIAGWDDEAPDPQRADARAPADDAGSEGTGGASGTPGAGGPSGSGTPGADDNENALTEGPATSTVALEPPVPEGAQTAAAPATAGAPDIPGTPPAAGGAGEPAGLELPIAPTTAHAWRGSSPPHDDADDPEDDHFVPPSEIDLPSAETDPMFWAIVGGLVGGPLLLLYVLFFDRDGSEWWVVTALSMVVVGFVLLVLRGGNERDPFDDGTRV